MYQIKKKLQNGKLVLGTMISEVRNPNITYMLAQCGFEFVIVDNEHGTYSFETISDMIAAARGAGISVIVRIPEITRANILKPLDAGAAGLLVPMVNTVDEAQAVVSHAKYPPLGNRGAALRRPHNLYAKVNAAEYLEQANKNTFIAVQAEASATEITKSLERGLNAVQALDQIDQNSLGVPLRIVTFRIRFLPSHQ